MKSAKPEALHNFTPDLLGRGEEMEMLMCQHSNWMSVRKGEKNITEKEGAGK